MTYLEPAAVASVYDFKFYLNVVLRSPTPSNQAGRRDPHAHDMCQAPCESIFWTKTIAGVNCKHTVL